MNIILMGVEEVLVPDLRTFIDVNLSPDRISHLTTLAPGDIIRISAGPQDDNHLYLKTAGRTPNGLGATAAVYGSKHPGFEGNYEFLTGIRTIRHTPSGEISII